MGVSFLYKTFVHYALASSRTTAASASALLDLSFCFCFLFLGTARCLLFWPAKDL